MHITVTILNITINDKPSMVVYSDDKSVEAREWLEQNGVGTSADDFDEYYANDSLKFHTIENVDKIKTADSYGLLVIDYDSCCEYEIIPFDINLVKERFGARKTTERIKPDEIVVSDEECEYRICHCYKIDKLFI